MEGNNINFEFYGNQKQVKMRLPFDPSVFVENNNGKNHRDKTEGRKHRGLIDVRGGGIIVRMGWS